MRPIKTVARIVSSKVPQLRFVESWRHVHPLVKDADSRNIDSKKVSGVRLPHLISKIVGLRHK